MHLTRSSSVSSTAPRGALRRSGRGIAIPVHVMRPYRDDEEDQQPVDLIVLGHQRAVVQPRERHALETPLRPKRDQLDGVATTPEFESSREPARNFTVAQRPSPYVASRADLKRVAFGEREKRGDGHEL